VFAHPADSFIVQDSVALPGDIFVVDRVNQAVRRISGNTVSTFHTTGLINPETNFYQFNFGGPFGGGILIEPPRAGCGPSAYDSGLFVAATGRGQIPLMSFYGGFAARDSAVVIGLSTTFGFDYTKVPPFRMPTGLARSRDYGGASHVENRVVYIADTGSHAVRAVRWGFTFEGCPVPKAVEVLAGAVDESGFRNGIGTLARFNAPLGLATGQDGSVYVADSGNHAIRRIAPDGIVTTVVGQDGMAGSNDGPVSEAHLNTPSGIDVTANGEIFIADTGNHIIRMVTKDGVLVTIAGVPGVAGYADGNTEQARFSGPVGLRALADGTILVADTSNNSIRKLTPVVSRRRVARP
jgi:hypothetical protein